MLGVSTGFLAGLGLGRNDRLARIFEPYIVASNSLPRIALVASSSASSWAASRAAASATSSSTLGTPNAADMMVALLTLGVIGIVMALGIKQVETRLLRWRPEYRSRA